MAVTLVVALLGLLVAPAAHAVDADNLPPKGGVCDLPVPGIQGACDTVDKISNIPTSPGDMAGALAGDVGKAAGNAIGKMVTDAGSWVLGKVFGFMERNTTVNLRAAWFDEHYRGAAQLGLALMGMISLMALLSAMVRGDTGEMFKVFLWRVPEAIIKTAVAVPAIMAALAVADAVTEAQAAMMGQDVSTGVMALGENINAASPAAGAPTVLIAIIVGLLVLLAGIIAWLWMIVRSVGIHLAVAFLPLLFAFGIMQSGNRIAKRVIGFIIALVVIKPVLMLAMALGVAATTAMGLDDDLSSAFVGGISMLAAVVSPMFVVQLVGASAAASVFSGADRLRNKATSTIQKHRPRSSSQSAQSVADHRRNQPPAPVPQPQPAPPPPQPQPSAQPKAPKPQPAPTPTPTPSRSAPSVQP